jgi:hypothetical protein
VLINKDQPQGTMVVDPSTKIGILHNLAPCECIVSKPGALSIAIEHTEHLISEKRHNSCRATAAQPCRPVHASD